MGEARWQRQTVDERCSRAKTSAREQSGTTTPTGSLTVRCGPSASQEQNLTVRVPFAIRKRGGRKLVVTPDGSVPIVFRQQTNTALVKALARAFRWRDMLESGVYGTIAELAAAEGLNSSYVSRVLRLTLLKPELVEAALSARSRAYLDVSMLLAALPTRWCEQRFE